MDITSFTLGILSVVFTFNLVGAVYNLVLVYKLKRELRDLNQMINDSNNWFTQKCDGFQESIDRNRDWAYNETANSHKELIRILDSRLDKLLSRVEALEEKNGITRKQKQTLND